jgi:hypothetical protein
VKRGLLVVVTLLAVASLVATMAYTSASVSNDTGVTIVATDEAHLAVEPNPDLSNFVYIQDGSMVIDFSAGGAGFQPGSDYFFEDLFFVTNNLDVPINLGMAFSGVEPGDPWPTGLRMVLTDKDCQQPQAYYSRALMWGKFNEFESGWYEGRYIELAPDETVGVSWHFDGVNATTLDSESWRLIIHSEAIR